MRKLVGFVIGIESEFIFSLRGVEIALRNRLSHGIRGFLRGKRQRSQKKKKQREIWAGHGTSSRAMAIDGDEGDYITVLISPGPAALVRKRAASCEPSVREAINLRETSRALRWFPWGFPRGSNG